MYHVPTRTRPSDTLQSMIITVFFSPIRLCLSTWRGIIEIRWATHVLAQQRSTLNRILENAFYYLSHKSIFATGDCPSTLALCLCVGVLRRPDARASIHISHTRISYFSIIFVAFGFCSPPLMLFLRPGLQFIYLQFFFSPRHFCFLFVYFRLFWRAMREYLRHRNEMRHAVFHLIISTYER